MLKKVMVGIVLVGLIGVLVFGAINRTMDRTGKVAQAQGSGRGRSANELNNRGGYGQGGDAERPYSLGGESSQQVRGGAQGSDRGRREASGDQSGSGQAQVDEWLQFQGYVASVDTDALVVQVAGGGQITVENRPWWFAQEQGFSAQVGDEVILSGFYEGEDVEIGRIDDATNGQTVLIRDENGRPLWAGRGRRGM
jgi:hypothetical protein